MTRVAEGRRKRGPCHPQKPVDTYPSKLFQFSSPSFISSKWTNTKDWKSKEFIYISLTRRSPHPTCNTRKFFSRPSKTRMSFNSIEFLCQISSLDFTQITRPHMSSGKQRKTFPFCYFSILLDVKCVKWFMRSSSADNKSFVQLFVSELGEEKRKLEIFRMITYWIFKPHLKHINFNDCLKKHFFFEKRRKNKNLINQNDVRKHVWEFAWVKNYGKKEWKAFGNCKKLFVLRSNTRFLIRTIP